MVRNNILRNKLPKKCSFPSVMRRLERRSEEARVNLAGGDKHISNHPVASLSRMKGGEQGQESHARASMCVRVF